MMPGRMEAASAAAVTLKMISISAVAILLTQPDPQFYVLCGVVFTSAAGIVSSWLRHKWDREERAEMREALKFEMRNVANIAQATKTDIRRDIADNTAINVAALDAANHNDAKIQALAKVVVLKEEVALDTNQTAHRIEDKL